MIPNDIINYIFEFINYDNMSNLNIEYRDRIIKNWHCGCQCIKLQFNNREYSFNFRGLISSWENGICNIKHEHKIADVPKRYRYSLYINALTH
jgi:hypothetical protein